MTNFFPLISCTVSGIFVILLVLQFLKRKKKHQIIWSIALLFWFVTTLSEFLGEKEIMGWNVLMYKLYYVLTAPMVALLGVGTLYLLTHKPWGKYFLIYTIIISIPLFILGLTAPVDTTKFALGSEIAGAAMPHYVRIFSPFLTVPGGLALVLGAIYSFWLDRTRKYNLLIAIGGLFPFLGGLRARFGEYTLFYALEMVGTLLLFIGFVLSWEYVQKRKAEK